MKSVFKYSYLVVIPFLPLLLACQKGEEAGVVRSGQENVGNPVVIAADGSGYSVQCLRSIAGQIQTQGKSAIDTCSVTMNSSSETAAQSNTRGKFFTSNYSWVYYPPTYYDPSSYTYNYPSSYSPYYDSSYSNNSFCSFVFGGNYNYNCYYIFGYTNPSNYSTYNYGNYYNPDCSGCLYSNHPIRCSNRCYRSYYY